MVRDFESVLIKVDRLVARIDPRPADAAFESAVPEAVPDLPAEPAVTSSSNTSATISTAAKPWAPNRSTRSVQLPQATVRRISYETDPLTDEPPRPRTLEFLAEDAAAGVH